MISAMKDVNSKADSSGHVWKVLSEEVTFALGLASCMSKAPKGRVKHELTLQTCAGT